MDSRLPFVYPSHISKVLDSYFVSLSCKKYFLHTYFNDLFIFKWKPLKQTSYQAGGDGWRELRAQKEPAYQLKPFGTTWVARVGAHLENCFGGKPDISRWSCVNHIYQLWSSRLLLSTWFARWPTSHVVISDDSLLNSIFFIAFSDVTKMLQLNAIKPLSK